MSAKKPNLAPLYGAAFGFNTDRLVKPVHFATGFFVSLFGQQYKTELLNNVVAFADGKDPEGNYALGNLHQTLRDAGKLHAVCIPFESTCEGLRAMTGRLGQFTVESQAMVVITPRRPTKSLLALATTTDSPVTSFTKSCKQPLMAPKSCSLRRHG